MAGPVRDTDQKNPTILKHGLLGVIHAAPNGISERMLLEVALRGDANMAATIGFGRREILSRLGSYRHARLIRREERDGAVYWHPTVKLAGEVDRWPVATAKPPGERRRLNVAADGRHPLWGRAGEIVDWWRDNPVSLRNLGKRFGCSAETVNKILHGSMADEEIREVRGSRGRTGHTAAGRASSVRCRCGGVKKRGALTCRACYDQLRGTVRRAA